MGAPPLLRRRWQLTGAILILGVLALLHLLWFQPTARRYEKLRSRRDPSQASIDVGQAMPLVPPRVLELLEANSLTPAQALERGNSGSLTVEMLGQLTALADRTGLTVLRTEPGPVTQQPHGVEISARMSLRGRHGQLLAYLDSLDADGRLDALERFTLIQRGDALDADLWMKRLVLKRPVRTP
jgi:hypothetical protein